MIARSHWRFSLLTSNTWRTAETCFGGFGISLLERPSPPGKLQSRRRLQLQQPVIAVEWQAEPRVSGTSREIVVGQGSIPNGFSRTNRSLSFEMMIFAPLANAQAKNGSSSGPH